MKDGFSKKLDKYFNQFSSTQALVNGLIKSKKYPQEILILLCSRIDALASSAAKEGAPSGLSFATFVTTYSGKSKLFDSVSVGDVYYELDYHLWLLPGMIEKAGRIHIFSRLNEPILKLLIESEIALTLEESQNLIRRLQRTLRRNFRVSPKQPRGKRPLASANEIKQTIRNGFGKQKGSLLEKGIDPLISSKRLARILYERFRCEVIHGGRVLIDEPRFFGEREPYWKPLYSDFYGPFQLVEFPAQFLASLFSDCIQNYRKRLEATRKVPPNIHFEMFPDNLFRWLDLLDEELLPEGRTIHPRGMAGSVKPSVPK
jgi:hypothetical protein